MAPNALRPMVSYRALELGASALDLGIVAGSYVLLSLFLAIPIGRWVDRIGEQTLLLLGSGTIIAAALLLITVKGLAALAFVQALLGLGQTATLVGLQSLTSSAGRPDQRDARIGAFTVVASSSQMVGPALAGAVFVLAGDSLDMVFATFAAITTVGAVTAASLLIWPPDHHERAGTPPVVQDSMLRSVNDVMRQPSVPHAMLASLTVLTTLDLLAAYLPAYGEASGIPVATITLLLSVRAAASVVSRIGMLALLRRLGRKRLLIISVLIPTAAIPLIVTTSDPVALGLLMTVAGVGLGLGQPLSLGWIAASVPVTMRGTAIGLRLFGNRSGQLILPIAVGAVAGATGIGAIFLTTGAMLGGTALLLSRAQMVEGRRSGKDPDRPD